MHSTPRSSSGEISPSRFVSKAAKMASSWCGGSSGATTSESIRWHSAAGSSSSRSWLTRIWRGGGGGGGGSGGGGGGGGGGG
eukprot:scaffold107079_cov72-Phaeocystis_antarctica.AAC.1